MNTGNKVNASGSTRLIWISIGFAALYWSLESAIHTFIFHHGTFIGQIFTRDPNELWMRLLIIFIISMFGFYAQVIINKRKLAEEALQDSERKYRGLVNNAIVGIYQTNLKGDLLYVNGALAKACGFASPDEMMSEGIIARYKDLKYRETLMEALKKTGEVSNFELEMLVKTGEARNVLLSAYLEGEVISGVVVDITERKQAEEAVYHLAYYDPLTALPNRTLFRNDLQQAIFKAKSENRPLTLLIINLERFREINNTLGHQCGDIILKESGERLQLALREADIIARLSGHSFAVLMKNRDAEAAAQTASKIIERLKEPFAIENIPLDIPASIGISLFPGHGEDADILIRRADIAIHTAKTTESGFFIYSPQHDQYSPARLALMGELRSAIEVNQLFLLYQPKIDLKSGKTIGVEALVRWKHPKLGIIPPDQFIALAEHTGLIKELTSWVLKEALRQSRSWHQAGIEISVAVNLSVRNLQAPQLLDQIKGLLSTWGISPDRIRFEITESIIMADPERAMEVITELTAIGINFSIDDFGTGYSSLSYLQRLPVDEIKIDKSFITGMMKDQNSMKIVRSVMELGHSLDLKVVAEGVETKEMLDKLILLGCDQAQGYFISRPVTQEEIIKFLSRDKRDPLLS